jgi:dipeptidyl aminopeptidase/acylaminoacyl peptidase
MAYVRFDGSVSHYQIFVANSDGSSPVRLSPGTNDDTWPRWAPNNSKIAFDRAILPSQSQVWTMNTDGTSATRLSAAADFHDANPTWSPDSSKVAFSHLDSVSGHNQIWQINANGTTEHAAFTGLTGFDLFHPAWSPDGTQIAFTLLQSGTETIITEDLNNGNLSQIVNSSSTSAAFPSWSPDGKFLAYEQGSTGGSSIHVVSQDGTNDRPLTVPGADRDPYWSLFPAKRTIVGSGAPLGTSAAGFMFGQNRHLVTSIVTFNATDPLSTTVTSQTSDNPAAGNIVFEVAGSLNSLKFQNGTDPKVTVLPAGSTTSATGALVSFDSQDGTVTSVIPFIASRARPTVSREGSMLVVTGSLLGVFDATGHNLAPSGAKEVRLGATGIAGVSG